MLDYDNLLHEDLLGLYNSLYHLTENSTDFYSTVSTQIHKFIDGISGLDFTIRACWSDELEAPLDLVDKEHSAGMDITKAHIAVLNTLHNYIDAVKGTNDLTVQKLRYYKSYISELVAACSADRYYLSTRGYTCFDADDRVMFRGDYKLIHKHVTNCSISFYDWTGKEQYISTDSFNEDIYNGRVKAITAEQFQYLSTIQGIIKRLQPVALADCVFADGCCNRSAKASLEAVVKQIEQQVETLEAVYSQECAAILGTEHRYKSEETNLFSD